MPLNAAAQELRERLIVLLVDNHPDFTAADLAKEALVLENFITGKAEPIEPQVKTC